MISTASNALTSPPVTLPFLTLIQRRQSPLLRVGSMGHHLIGPGISQPAGPGFTRLHEPGAAQARKRPLRRPGQKRPHRAGCGGHVSQHGVANTEVRDEPA